MRRAAWFKTAPSIHVDAGQPSADANDASALVSVPLQNSTNFNVGPPRGHAKYFQVQPVFPGHFE
jgi:hypothetical protein